MVDFSALPVTNVNGVQVTDDGKHALIHLTSGQNDLTLAFDVDSLPHVLVLVSHAYGQAKSKADPSRDGATQFECHDWEIGFGDQPDELVMTASLPAGMKLSFIFKSVVADRLSETLKVLRDASTHRGASTKLM